MSFVRIAAVVAFAIAFAVGGLLVAAIIFALVTGAAALGLVAASDVKQIASTILSPAGSGAVLAAGAIAGVFYAVSRFWKK